MKTIFSLRPSRSSWAALTILPFVLASSLQGEIKGEKLGDGFVRTTEEPSGPAINGFVERDGKRFGKIDATTYSSFVSVGNQCSFVPTDAILHVPDSMKARVSKEKTGKIVLWPRFHRSNRGYFHTVEVSVEEFTGKKPISEARMKQWQSLGRIVIAVYRGNPITVPKVSSTPSVVLK